MKDFMHLIMSLQFEIAFGLCLVQLSLVGMSYIQLRILRQLGRIEASLRERCFPKLEIYNAYSSGPLDPTSDASSG